MELFQTTELQSSEVQGSCSSVLWFGLTLAVVWLLGVSGVQATAPVESLLAGLTASLQTIF